MSSPSPRLRLRSAFVAALALGGTGCVSLRVPTSPAPRVVTADLPKDEAQRAVANLKVFDQVWDQVHRKYYDSTFNGLNWEELARTYGPQAAAAPDSPALYATLNEMLGKLEDSHTAAVEPRIATEERTGQRALVGITMRRVDGRWVIDDVLPGGTAAAAGVSPGWIILSRDGVPMPENYSRPEQRPGQVIHWEFLTPDGRTVALDLKVQPLPTARLETRELANGLVYIRFDGFDLKATRWLSDQLEKNRDAPGVLLDLRHNGGGLVVSALFAVGEFFPEAVPAFITLDQEGSRYRWASFQLSSAHYSGRVAVLTGPATASAAEILSAVLQEKDRATIIGQRTAGALLAATQARLPDNGLVQVSQLDLITMGGKRLEDGGLEPDIAVPAPEAERLRSGEDRELETAIALLSQP